MLVDDPSHLCENFGINSVNLCQIPHGTGKITDLPGIDHGDGKAFRLERAATAASSPLVASIRTSATECFMSPSRMASKPSESLLTVN